MTYQFEIWFFFFQAEDGIRDIGVTGVQTCALPILASAAAAPTPRVKRTDEMKVATDVLFAVRLRYPLISSTVSWGQKLSILLAKSWRVVSGSFTTMPTRVSRNMRKGNKNNTKR